MKKIITVLLMAIALPLAAQPTFTSSDFLQAFAKLNSGGTTDYTHAGGTALQKYVTMSGASQTWDLSGETFSQGTVTSSGVSVVAYPGGAANASDFTGATHVLINTNGNVTTYEFFKVSTSGFYIMGASEDSAGVITTQIKYTPGLQILAFPLTYQTSWTSTSSVQVAGYPVTVTQSIEGYGDAWGTVKVPNLTESQCVRVRTKTTTGIPGVFSTSSYHFNWYNASGFDLTISADSNQNANGGDYSVPQTNAVAMHPVSGTEVSILGNPAVSKSTVEFTMPEDGSVKVEVLDVLGQRASEVFNGLAHSGLNSIPIRTDALANGTYMVRVATPNSSTTQKLIITH